MNKRLPIKAMLPSIALLFSTSFITESSEIYRYPLADFAEITCHYSNDSVKIIVQSNELTPSNTHISIKTSSTVRYTLSAGSRYQLSLSHPNNNVIVTLSTPSKQTTLALQPNCQPTT